LSRLMSHFLQTTNQQINLLVATSGDTGGAIAHGFADVPHIRVHVLFPAGRVSQLQKEQLTRVADNVFPLEVAGVFDDCQALVKRAFNDPDLAGLNLTSANSISIGRLIPQIIYYVYAYAQLPREDLAFVVPSGNFGNLTGGLLARGMGLPFNRFVAATNVNDTAVRYFQTSHYDPHPTIPTLSNAMDVGNPSNFVRVLELLGHDHARFAELIHAYSATDEATVQTIQQVYDRFGYLLDPHTAVGWQVAAQNPDSLAGYTPIIVATADPLKFAQEITAVAGIPLDNSAALAPLRHRPARQTNLPADYDSFKAYLLTLNSG
jgi:threonine synthase